MRRMLQRLRDDERGHVMVGAPSLVAAIGAIVLGYGAAGDSDTATVIGGFVLAAGIFVTGLARHRSIDYDVFRRLDELEKK